MCCANPLFYERVISDIVLMQPPRILTPALPEVRQAAEQLGIDL